MKFIDYLRETRAEMKHVSWPSRKQAIVYTAFVIVISLVVGGILGVFDYIFSLLLENII